MEWQPIETAPRDGTRVLVFDPHRFPRELICRWRGNSWWGDLTPSGRCIVWSDDAGCHWMPLPQPPKDAP
jgi:hypothetical protein